MERNEAQIRATTQKDFENGTLSERRQSQNTMCCRIPLTANVQERQSIDQWLPRTWGAGGKQGVTANRYKVFLQGDEDILRMTVGDPQYTKITGLSTFIG